MIIFNKLYVRLFLILIIILSGCESPKDRDMTVTENTKLQVWAHAGQEAERIILQQQIARFNHQNPEIEIDLTFVPEREYNAQVQAAAIAGDLPDILEFDGPYLYNYIWQNQLVPLEKLLPQSVVNDLLPSIIDQGTHGSHLYSVGTFDSGLGLYARKDVLEALDIRIPENAGEAWNMDEFDKILRKLAEKDDDGAVLDIKLNYGGEWFTYGFSPILQSAGSDLINRKDYQHSQGVLNGHAAVDAMKKLQSWILDGYIDPNIDDAAFATGRVALSWVGHWEYNRYSSIYPDNLVLVPLPDFGHGSKTGQGSWNWGITGNCKTPQKAATFLSFLLKPEEILAMSRANSAVPGTRTAITRSDLYSENGPLRIFAEQLIEGYSVPRPKTPAYPVITTAFQKAFQQIRNNGDVKKALDVAAETIDQDIADNRGYPFRDEK